MSDAGAAEGRTWQEQPAPQGPGPGNCGPGTAADAAVQAGMMGMPVQKAKISRVPFERLTRLLEAAPLCRYSSFSLTAVSQHRIHASSARKSWASNDEALRGRDRQNERRARSRNRF